MYVYTSHIFPVFAKGKNFCDFDFATLGKASSQAKGTWSTMFPFVEEHSGPSSLGLQRCGQSNLSKVKFTLKGKNFLKGEQSLFFELTRTEREVSYHTEKNMCGQ